MLVGPTADGYYGHIPDGHRILKRDFILGPTRVLIQNACSLGYLAICMFIHTYSERERERQMCIYIHPHIRIEIYIYIGL